ncbi:MAG: aminotransferase class I/II-fold pyridoxal phosphate-dependent enzyme [Candidatus Nanoarchaeia archaeon]
MPISIRANKDVIDMEYAVRGPIPQAAALLKEQGKEIIFCNIGNPQALGQSPLSFAREVLALLENKALISRMRAYNRKLGIGSSNEEPFFSDYIIDYAEKLISHFECGLGEYTESKGLKFIREAVARFIDRRDGPSSPPSDPENIILYNGASEAAHQLIQILIASRNDGIMIPIPQYPLYSAVIKKFGGIQVNYYPDEDSGWPLHKSELERAFNEAVAKGINIKAIVVINPSNPTGAILDEQSIKDVIDFAEEKGISIIADEVYQENIYDDSRFISFAKVLGNRDVPLFSLHSVSKGFFGECGHRGGYLEVRNPPKINGMNVNILDLLLKMASVDLCSNTAGQALVYMMVNPPEKGSEPFENFQSEKRRILETLAQKAKIIKEAFAQMDGVRVFGRTGAMYLFPRLEKLPKGKNDFDYCMALLEKTGICTVNGAGFGQKEGTYHFRIAFLPPVETLKRVLPRWIEFHNKYVNS